jgi:DNA-directed RNA polymerase specialized sigma subunit
MKQPEQRQTHVNPIMRLSGNEWREYIGPKASLFDQIESLPENEKLVLALHYYEGLSFLEIGWLMEIEEWDAVVLHTQALSKLNMNTNESTI